MIEIFGNDSSMNFHVAIGGGGGGEKCGRRERVPSEVSVGQT